MVADRTYTRVADPARDAAWQKWVAEQDYRVGEWERDCAREAFMAGWEARKRAHYSGDVS
jgi:hypothetical protein